MKYKDLFTSTEGKESTLLNNISSYINSSDLQEKEETSVCLFSMGKSSDSTPVRVTSRNVAKKIEKLNSISLTEVTDEVKSILLEDQLQVETWQGFVVLVENNTIVLEVRNDRFRDVKRKLRIRKDEVENIEQVFTGIGAEIRYVKKRNYNAVIEESLKVSLRVPPVVPKQVLENEYNEKVERYKYMWEV